MEASQVCAMPGCPVLVTPSRTDTTFCTEMHMALYQISEIQNALVMLARGQVDELHFEHLALGNVTGKLPVRRSGSLDDGRSGKVW